MMTRRRLVAGAALGGLGLAAYHMRAIRAPSDVGATGPEATEKTAALTPSDLEWLRAQAGMPALAVAARVQSAPLRAMATGVRQRGLAARVTAADRWHIGSITKSMTATLVARCVEAGHVAWDDTVLSVLGDMLTDIRAEYRQATFLHLLSHRAGLQTEVMAPGGARDSRLAIARDALRQRPAGPLATTFHYSNSGYVIAAAMLEARLGASWEELMRAKLFAPLGMRASGFGPPGRDGEGDQPVGHASWVTPSVTPHPPGAVIDDIPAAWRPAGGVHAAPADMIAFLDAHRDRAPMLTPHAWTMLHTPPFGGEYALGWHVRPEGLWHNGTNSMWYAEALADPARRRSAFAACNDGRVDAVRGVVHAALMGALEPGPVGEATPGEAAGRG